MSSLVKIGIIAATLLVLGCASTPKITSSQSQWKNPVTTNINSFAANTVNASCVTTNFISAINKEEPSNNYWKIGKRFNSEDGWIGFMSLVAAIALTGLLIKIKGK